jgi:hypothetical protein
MVRTVRFKEVLGVGLSVVSCYPPGPTMPSAGAARSTGNGGAYSIKPTYGRLRYLPA